MNHENQLFVILEDFVQPFFRPADYEDEIQTTILPFKVDEKIDHN